MNRLQYSFLAFLRRMQMSKHALFVFVEGYTDRYIYSMLVDSVCKGKITYNVVTSYELDHVSGGKDKLLNFFDFLKIRKSLTNSFKKKRTIACFFFDKDVDDVIRKLRHSKNLIYTRYFQLENYLYMYGDICKATAIAAALDINSVTQYFKKHPNWRKNAATCWKDWIVFCLFSLLHTAKPICNYGQHESPINDRAYDVVNKSKYKNYLSRLKSLSCCDNLKFQQKFKRVTTLVNKSYTNEEFDSLFKGKWYICFLIEDIRKLASKRQCSFSGLEERLLNNLSSTLDFNDRWTEDFKIPLINLLKTV